MDKYEKFHVGINVFVVKNNKLLLGKRRNIFGSGTWGLPGGHLENRESMKAAAARELEEETGLKANEFEFTNVVNDRKQGRNHLHYLQIGFIAKEVEGDPMVKEPKRCEVWDWFPINNLPQEIFPAHKSQIQLFIKGLQFSDN